MKFLYFLNICSNRIDLGKNLAYFAQLPDEKSADPGESNFYRISPLNSPNLVLISGANFDGHRDSWTGCT